MAMQNYLFEQNVHQFFIDGGDSRTMKSTYLWIVLTGIVFLASFYYWNLEQWIPPLAWLTAYVVIIGGVLFYLSKGKMARYLVRIDCETGTIKAIDQQEHQDLWEDDFKPEKLFLSEIQVFIGAQSYRYPALVYGDMIQELVEDGVPYSSKVVLGFGEKAELEEIKEKLSS